MKKKVLIGLMVLVLCFAVFNIVLAVTATPGSSDDPLITSSFLDNKLQALTTSIGNSIDQKLKQFGDTMTVLDNKVEDMNKKVGQAMGGSTTGNSFIAVNVPSGKKLIGEAGTEIILRSGNAKVVSETSAGLSDVTSGNDIIKDSSVAKNHLIIIPRADGRGISAENNSVVMVKGGYQIQ